MHMLLTKVFALHNTILYSAIYTFSSLLLVSVVPCTIEQAVASLYSVIDGL